MARNKLDNLDIDQFINNSADYITEDEISILLEMKNTSDNIDKLTKLYNKLDTELQEVSDNLQHNKKMLSDLQDKFMDIASANITSSIDNVDDTNLEHFL